MKKAFTLVELLIVIIIIGILATIAVPQYNKMVEKAKWAESPSVLSAINKAMVIYYAEHSHYPALQSAYIYLNGPNAAPQQADILIDVPAYPASTKFIYVIISEDYFQPGGELEDYSYGSFAFIDQNSNATHDHGEPFVEILDGNFFRKG